MSESQKPSQVKQDWLKERLKKYKENKTPSLISSQSRPAQLPLSFAQQRLWFLEQWEKESTAYLLPSAWRLRGPVNLTALNTSLSALIARHESLRTRFSLVDEEPVQIIDPPHSISLATQDLSHLSPVALEKELQQLVDQERQQPFDLSTGPLWRGQFFILGSEEYLLLFTMHHIITDGWSMSLVWKEWCEIYTAHVAGHSDALPPLPFQYADYAIWQRQWLQSPELKQQQLYWQAHLAEAPSQLDLPIEGARPPRETHIGDQITFTIPSSQAMALKALSQKEGVTLFMTLLAIFQVLLLRYTNQKDILVGTPIAGRTHTDLEGLIGFFVNTLVMRIQFKPKDTFRDVFQRVRETCLDAYAHQDLPFEKLVEILNPIRDPSRHPLFQVMFQLHHQNDSAGFRLPNIKVDSIPGTTHTAKFDLLLSLISTKAELKGSIIFNTTLLSGAMMEQMANHYQQLLNTVITNPQASVHQTPILDQKETLQVLVDWDNRQSCYPLESCVHELFEIQVKRTPDTCALVFQEHLLSYEKLDIRANQLAHYLRREGVRPETLVGIQLDRGPDLLISLLAILKAGGAYVPLDPSYPTERLEYMLINGKIDILISPNTINRRFSSLTGKEIFIDWATFEKEPTITPIPLAKPDNLAYVIYTSGSTGKPKGVQISHRALCNLLYSMNDDIHLESQDCWMAVTNISFDIAALELFCPLLFGAKVILPTNGICQSGDQLAQAINESNTSIMQATPATWQMLLDSGWTGKSDLTVLCGGESLSPPLAKGLSERTEKVYNVYGPTEATIWTTIHTVTHSSSKNIIGRPLPNTKAFIFDERLNLSPIGVLGELYLGGIGIARGYLHRPDLTAERFTPHPFSRDPGERIYRTGDQVRWQTDGCLEFFGRLDHQVKVRGFRIELGEIESGLLLHPAITQTVATTYPDTAGGQQLVAYYVLDPSFSPPPHQETLREHLKQILPNYMIPNWFIELSHFPLTPNGKLDRPALPPPLTVCREDVATLVPPTTPTQVTLAGIWGDVLGLEQVGIRTSFFDLGGHSLLVIKLLARIRAETGIQLAVGTLFQHPTIEALEEQLLETLVGQTSEHELTQLLEELEES